MGKQKVSSAPPQMSMIFWPPREKSSEHKENKKIHKNWSFKIFH